MLDDSSVYPKKIWTDRGREFEGDFKTFCKDAGIQKYNTDSGTKAAYAERAIRSLKNIISKFLEEEWRWRYIDKLQTFVNIMNNRKNRSIGMAPAKVDTKDVFAILHKSKSQNMKPKFQLGDKVRISAMNRPFRKGYKQQFSEEIFIVDKIFSTSPPAYILMDENQENIQGKFYETEMILVTDP